MSPEQHSTRSALRYEEFRGIQNSLAGIASGRNAAVCRQAIIALPRRSRWRRATGDPKNATKDLLGTAAINNACEHLKKSSLGGDLASRAGVLSRARARAGAAD
jgi:hypothetical protein